MDFGLALLPPPKPHHSPPASQQHPSFPPARFPSAVKLLACWITFKLCPSALSWIIILHEMFVLYPPPVLKCQECIPRPSIFNTSVRAWQFPDMNIMALHAEPPSLKLTSVRISSLEQSKWPFHMQCRFLVTLHLLQGNQRVPAIPSSLKKQVTGPFPLAKPTLSRKKLKGLNQPLASCC